MISYFYQLIKFTHSFRERTKIISNPELYKKEIPIIKDEIKNAIQEVPCFITTREKAWQFLGFKHVNGPAKWGSYAKAKYISQVHNNQKVTLDEIASQIGDTHKTVKKLYQGLMVIEQAEKENIFQRDNIKGGRFAFSHIYTGLQYNGFSSFLDLKDENEDTTDYVPRENLSKLKELLQWVYGNKIDNIEPVVQSQNPDLRNLNAVLEVKEATIALRESKNLKYAFEMTRPTQNVFEEELMAAKRSLIKVKGLVTQGYDRSESLLRVAGTIADLAESIYNEMEKIKQDDDNVNKPDKKKRLTED